MNNYSKSDSQYRDPHDEFTDMLRELTKCFLSDIALQEEAPQDEAPQEEAPREETPQDETPQDETPQQREDDVFHEVEKILDKKMLRGGARYKVKWAGWPENECTWEPLNHLQDVLDLVYEFDQKRAAGRRYNGEPVYEVEKIIGKRMRCGETRYRVKWAGWPENECTWEPLENLQNVLDLVYKFNKREKALRRDRAKARKTDY